jgi:hypothetical protein
LVSLGLALTALASGETGPCDLDRMTRLIDKEIRDSGRSPSEYVMETPRRDGVLIYIGMAQKTAPLYRRHYLIDPSRCRIANLLIDQ